jgi:hypothetical protein
MKIKLLVLSCCFYFVSFSQSTQNSNDVSLTTQVKELEKKLNNCERQLRVNDLKLRLMVDENNKANEAIKIELKSNLALQAQNERAVNLTLDQFSKQFQEQNQTMAGVKESLQKQAWQQLLLFSVLIITFLIAIFIAIKISTKKALQNNQSSWNAFNTFVISGKWKNQ